MTEPNQAQPLTRQTGIARLLAQAPRQPVQYTHSYDDEHDVEWRSGGQIQQLALEPGATRAEWFSACNDEPIVMNRQLQQLDITDPATWQPLFAELQSWK